MMRTSSLVGASRSWQGKVTAGKRNSVQFASFCALSGAFMVKILSGGQTGVDRAALDAAITRGLPCGGWCPKGGWAEDMPGPPGLLALYPMLQETPLGDPAQRT